MAKVLALILVILFLAGGAGAGYVLRPVEEPVEEAEDVVPIRDPIDAVATFRDGFVVPILRDGKVWSHVVLRLGVASDQTDQETILLREPVLRDGLNQSLFLHGSLGGFDGDFTNPVAMERLRTRLDGMISARLDDETARILIVSMSRQGL